MHSSNFDLMNSLSASSFSISGFTAGIILAAAIGYMIVAQGKKVNLKPFFSVSTFFLILFAAGMVAYGTHEFEEFIVKGGHLDKLGLGGNMTFFDSNSISFKVLNGTNLIRLKKARLFI